MEISTLITYGVAGVAILAMLLLYKWVLRVFGIILVPEDSIAIINKKFVLFGTNKTLPEGQIVALNGEAGIQADTLAPGVHFWYWPWQYEVRMQQFIRIPEGQFGVVESSAGVPLPRGRILATKKLECESFQNARAFLESGGERGPQSAIIPPGTYRINTAIFTVQAAKVTDIPDNQVGVVTTKEGVPLPAGEIAGAAVEGHNSFQDPQAFTEKGGNKGLQEQVILAGRYFINPRFASIELVPMTTVPIANVGVVIAYVGKAGKDVTGDTFKHGNLVNKNEKGVWVEPLDPGKYAINPYTHKVENVPTANVVLNWATGKTESHNLDKNLSTITVRSSDGFPFNLDVSQIIHVPRTEAPKVIARFGNMMNLVTQVLEPTIGNYFRNAAQASDAIDFLRNRQQRQEAAKMAIHGALDSYNVEAVDTLIGDINPPAELMKTLTDRKVAEQQKITFKTQQESEEQRKLLMQATAMANTQASVVDAERTVQIQEFKAKANVAQADGEAQSKVIQAKAEAQRVILTGDAEAQKTLAVGGAEASVVKQKIDSMESGNFAAIEVAKALASSGKPLVPDIVMTGGNNGNGDSSGSLVSMLLLETLRDKKAA